MAGISAPVLSLTVVALCAILVCEMWGNWGCNCRATCESRAVEDVRKDLDVDAANIVNFESETKICNKAASISKVLKPRISSWLR